MRGSVFAARGRFENSGPSRLLHTTLIAMLLMRVHYEAVHQSKRRAARLCVALPLLGLLASAVCPVVSTQILPPSLGEVEVTKRAPKPITRTPTGAKSTPKRNNGIIFVLTEPPDADVAINGKRAGRAINGELRAELAARGRYVIRVSAGTGFEPYEKTVAPKSGSFEIVRAALVSKYGLVKIGPALEGWKVFIDDKELPADKIEPDKESNAIQIDNLTPGEHKISYRHPDYVPLERQFTISASSEYLWTFRPEPATVGLTVATDPETLVYIDGEFRGKTPGDGILKKGDIKLGRHTIKLFKEDYEEYTDTKEFKYREPMTLEKRLTALPTSAEFSDDFDVPKPEQWTMPPSGAVFTDKRLYLENAPAVAFPTTYRYRDFVVNFNLRLTNAGGAAWAVRVRDSGNYYLFYLAGPEGLFPNRFATYIVRNNDFDPKKPFRTDQVTTALVAGAQYTIEIKGTGKIIENKITPARTGNPENIGFFDDKSSTFLLGGIGFRTVASEKFSIDDLFAKPR